MVTFEGLESDTDGKHVEPAIFKSALCRRPLPFCPLLEAFRQLAANLDSQALLSSMGP